MALTGKHIGIFYQVTAVIINVGLMFMIVIRDAFLKAVYVNPYTGTIVESK